MDNGPRRLHYRQEKQLHLLRCLPPTGPRPRRGGAWRGPHRNRPQCRRHRRDGPHEQLVECLSLYHTYRQCFPHDNIYFPPVQSCEVISRGSAGALRSARKAKTLYDDRSRSSMPTKRKLSCVSLLLPSSLHSPFITEMGCAFRTTTTTQVRVLQETGLLLHRVHIFARCVPRPRTCIPEGP
jgi:hypothetical protein